MHGWYTRTHEIEKKIHIWNALFLRVDFASGACLVTTEFNVPRINLAQTAMLQTTFAVLLQLLVLLQQYNSGCCLIRLFSSFYRVWALAAQLQIAWNSNFNHLRLHTLFIVIGCAIKKNWSPTTNCKTWCLYYYKITFHCVNNHVHTHTMLLAQQLNSQYSAIAAMPMNYHHYTQLTYGRIRVIQTNGVSGVIYWLRCCCCCCGCYHFNIPYRVVSIAMTNNFFLWYWFKIDASNRSFQISLFCMFGNS